jgi:hypothetical protein
MSDLTGQQWIVENKGGSGGNVGMDALAQSAPDGYSLGLGGIASHAIAPTLYAKLPFNPRTDFTFVSTMWQLPNMLVVNLELPAKSVPELIELLKKNPGKYSYGSAGFGTVYTYTVVRQHGHPFFRARAPYVVAYVDLDEGFRMLAEVVGDPDTVQIGQRVAVDWEDHDEVSVPVFRAAGAA